MEAPPKIMPEDAGAFDGMEVGQHWRMKVDSDIQTRIDGLESDDVGPWVNFSIRRVSEDDTWDEDNTLNPTEFRTTYELLPDTKSSDMSLPTLGDEFAQRERPHIRARVENGQMKDGVAWVEFSTAVSGSNWARNTQLMRLSEFLFVYVPLSEVATGGNGRNPDGSPRIQLVITYMDESMGFYPLNQNSQNKQGWKIDAGLGVLIIGRGYGRVIVPLCNIRSFSPEKY